MLKILISEIKYSWVPRVGIIGKPNSGKSTFFSALTKIPVKIAPYPFTTIEPNKGIAYVRVECVCKEFNVKDNPRNSVCINGIRYVPVEIVDVAGLVPDAWKGRGLGNKFLDEIRKADSLILVVDASGTTDEEGRIVKQGKYDPINEPEFVFNEILMWVFNNLKEEINKEIRKIQRADYNENVQILEQFLSGFSLKRKHISSALVDAGLQRKKVAEWSEEEIKAFCKVLLLKSKPILIAANKIDLPRSHENYLRMKEKYKDFIVIPTSAESELALNKAKENKIIEYDDGKIRIIKELNEDQRKAIEYIQKNVLEKYGTTGVKEALETCYFKLLNYIAVFPVEDANKLTDHHGNVLPDVFLVPSDMNVREFASEYIHSDLGKYFLYAIDVRRKQKVGENYILKHRDVIKIVSSK